MDQPTDGLRYRLGAPATITIETPTGATKVEVRIGAIMPERLSTNQQILIPEDLLPDDLIAAAPAEILLKTHSPDDVDTVRAAAEPYGAVTSVHDWVASRADAMQRTNNATLVVLLALAGLYTLMAVINAIVIAGTGRRREYAVARLSGLTRTQVVGTTALEAAITTLTGLVLGLVVVASAILGIALAADRSVGTTVVDVPWTLLAATTLGALAIATATAALVAALVTRTRPIAIAAAKE